MQYIFLSHDVDYRRQGPPVEFILERKDRFEKEVIENLNEKNPYYGIPDLMELEEKFGVKSTFFFRTIYENGSFNDYEDDIKLLLKSGWEIGLHSDPSSIQDIEKIQNEKIALETLTRSAIIGNRVHFLKFDNDLPSKLSKLGFIYDSTVRNSKNRIDKDEMGHYKLGNIIEFPLTLMDAYLFTYMKISEDGLVETFKKTLDLGRTLANPNVITVNWHDSVLQMKGGRMYKKILEYLTSQDDVKICRGIDLAKILV